MSFRHPSVYPSHADLCFKWPMKGCFARRGTMSAGTLMASCAPCWWCFSYWHWRLIHSMSTSWLRLAAVSMSSWSISFLTCCWLPLRQRWRSWSGLSGSQRDCYSMLTSSDASVSEIQSSHQCSTRRRLLVSLSARQHSWSWSDFHCFDSH